MRALAVGVLAVALLATAFLQSGASAALKQTVDPTWRGAYDILVTAPDAARSELLAPNSLSTSGSAMDLDDVEVIRQLSVVELAAPIGQVVVSANSSWGIELSAPIDTALSVPAPEAFRGTLRLMTDDGLGERLVSERQFGILLDRADVPELPQPTFDQVVNSEICPIGDVPVPCVLHEWNERRVAAVAEPMHPLGQSVSFGQAMGTASDDGFVKVMLPEQVTADQRVVLIDPVAERALLGDTGSFLDPLIDLGVGQQFTREELGDWANGFDTPHARALVRLAQSIADNREAQMQSAAYQEYLRVKAERGEQPDAMDYFGDRQAVVPILVAEKRNPAPLRAELALESFGPVAEGDLPRSYLGTAASFPEAIRNGDPGAPIGATTQNMSPLLDSLWRSPVPIPWPGSSAPEQAAEHADLSELSFSGAVSVLNVEPGPLSFDHQGKPAVRLEGVGFRAAQFASGVTEGGLTDAALRSNPSTPGAEAIFTVARVQEVSMALRREEAHGISVGAFSDADLQAVVDQLGGVPLGAYEPVSAELVKSAAGAATQPTPITPALNGFGLLGATTTAIADIGSQNWRAAPVVEAIRVRVAGVSSYDSEGIATVTTAAAAIEELGFTATIVAGTRPETVQVSIGNYAFGTTDAAGAQRVGELGVVEQTWSILGPAANAGLHVSAASRLLLGVALLSALALLAVVELGAVPARRREAAVLRSAGWQRASIVRWFAAEQAPAWLLLAASVTIAALASGPSGEVGLTATAVGIVLLCASAITLCAIVRASQPPVEAAAAGVRQLAHAQAAHRPQVRVNSHTGVNPDAHPGPVAPTRAARTRVASSPVWWGVRHATRRGDSLPAALAVLVGMSAVGSLSAVFAESAGGTGGSLPGNTQALIVLLPQIALSVCAATAGVLLLLVVRNRSAADRAAEDRLLRESGWGSQDRRRVASAGTLVVTLGAVLIGAYALWFVFDSIGTANSASTVNSAVSAAIVAGVVMTALFLVPLSTFVPSLRKPVAPNGTAARTP